MVWVHKELFRDLPWFKTFWAIQWGGSGGSCSTRGNKLSRPLAISKEFEFCVLLIMVLLFKFWKLTSFSSKRRQYNKHILVLFTRTILLNPFMYLYAIKYSHEVISFFCFFHIIVKYTWYKICHFNRFLV